MLLRRLFFLAAGERREPGDGAVGGDRLPPEDVDRAEKRKLKMPSPLLLGLLVSAAAEPFLLEEGTTERLRWAGDRPERRLVAAGNGIPRFCMFSFSSEASCTPATVSPDGSERLFTPTVPQRPGPEPVPRGACASCT